MFDLAYVGLGCPMNSTALAFTFARKTKMVAFVLVDQGKSSQVFAIRISCLVFALMLTTKNHMCHVLAWLI